MNNENQFVRPKPFNFSITNKINVTQSKHQLNTNTYANNEINRIVNFSHIKVAGFLGTGVGKNFDEEFDGRSFTDYLRYYTALPGGV